MILKRLIEILKSFGKDELKKFSRFIRSDYFNTNERITALFKSLKKFYPDFNDTKLTSEYLFRQIYESRSFDDKTFRYVLSELLELAEKFVARSFFENDSVAMERNVVEGLMARALYGQAYRYLKASEGKLDKDFVISETDIQNKINFSDLWKHLIFISSRQEPQLDKRIEHAEYLTLRNIRELSSMVHSLNVIKISYNLNPEDNAMFGYTNNFNYKAMLGYLDKLGRNLGKNKNRQGLVNALKIYLCFMITFLDSKDEEYFYMMKELVEKNSGYFNTKELLNLYVMLTSCCNIKRRTIDNDKYIRNYFEVVKSALQKNLFAAYKGHYMDVAGFYRIFLTALYLKEYAWAEGFARKYENQLSPQFKDDFYHYTRAELNFWNGKYEDTLGLLSKVGFNFYRLKVNVRSLMLMVYYELEYVEEAFSLLDSFAHFLRSNKKISDEMREQNLNFVYYAGQVLKYKLKNDKKKISALKNDISNCSQLYNKNWLLEKTNELK